MKKCNKCGIDQELTQYVSDKRNKDGLQGICNPCRKLMKQTARASRIRSGNIPMVAEKSCNKCHKTKPNSEFYADAGIADGLATICKRCKSVSVKGWRTKKREEYNEYMRIYRKRHPVKYEMERARSLRNRYGISLEDYEKMLTNQQGKCGLCDAVPKPNRPLYVDHCHDSGAVRGLLCASCNRSMHMLDSPDLLKRAIEYKNRI